MKTTDFLTELSTDKLAQYKTAAAADASKADKEGDFKRGDKRFSGIVKATKKQFANATKQGVAEGHDDNEEEFIPQIYARVIPGTKSFLITKVLDVNLGLKVGDKVSHIALTRGKLKDIPKSLSYKQGVAEGSEWETRHDEFTTVGDRATPEQINKIVKALIGAAQQAGSKRGFLNQLVGKQSNGDLARMAHVAETLAKNIQKNSNAKPGSDERKELGQHLVYAVSLLKRKSGEQGVAEGKWDPFTGGDYGQTPRPQRVGQDSQDNDIAATDKEKDQAEWEAILDYYGTNALVQRALGDLYKQTHGRGYHDSVVTPDRYLATIEKTFAGKTTTEKKYFSNKQAAHKYAKGSFGHVVSFEKIDDTEDTTDLITLPVMLGLGQQKKKWMLRFPDEGYAQKWAFKHKNVATIMWPAGHNLEKGVAEGLLGSDPNRGQKVPDWAKRGIVGKIGQKLDTAWSDVQMTVPQHLLSKQSSVPATNSLATKNMPKATSITPTRAIPQSVGTKLSQPAKNVVKTIADKQDVAEEKCPHCGGEMVSEELINEKKDACYYKVKSRYKVWPSAYASGALVKCRNKGASNWGNSSKNESSILEGIEQADESLHDWFNKEKWVRMDTKGNIKGPCAKEPGEGKPKCLPQSKAHSLGKKGRASAAARKRREDPNPDRSGKAINVNTKKKD